MSTETEISAAGDEVVTAEAADIQIRVEGMGLADRMVYTKADLVVGCRLGPSYAFSFYQFDYQDVVTSSVVLKATADPTESTGEKLTVPAKPMPVVKVVLDIEGFKLLLAEVNRIAEKVGIREA